MYWIPVLAVILLVLSNRKRGWSFPTKADKDWAESHQDLINRNL